MARSGVASRRASERLIAAGKVCVNGVRVTKMGTTVDPERDLVTVNGAPIKPETTFHYLILHKPAGRVTTVRDPKGRPTVMELLPDVGARLYPVGRLDAATTGLLLFTNDGKLANKLMHPRFEVPKRYRAVVQGRASSHALRRLRRGVSLDDGVTAPAKAQTLRVGEERSVIEITLIEGRNRQVRRMGAAVGHPVLQLQRVGFGPLSLGDLTVGRCRALSQAEVIALRHAVGEK